MADLKSCPFCGEKERLHHVENITGLHYIECEKCGASPSRLGAFDYETAIRYWNGELMPNTNGDRIRRMTDEEISEMLDIWDVEEVCEYCIYHVDLACHNKCYAGILAWLKQEANENAGHS